jgi:hypothetical protein
VTILVTDASSNRDIDVDNYKDVDTDHDDFESDDEEDDHGHNHSSHAQGMPAGNTETLRRPPEAARVSEQSTGSQAGILMRALYEYTAIEEGELTFAPGDLVTQIEPEDELGWCRGVLENGTVGVFPAGYCEPVHQ